MTRIGDRHDRRLREARDVLGLVGIFSHEPLEQRQEDNAQIQ